MIWVFAVAFVSSINVLAAPSIDESKLPPPAIKQIDFAQDIKPIFDASCIRCHGPVKPKSGFRLDNRNSAFKGGENGVDIVPGNSAKSPLIHYTAHLVEDMEMPPPGKGEQLTATQVGLLRAWIDQGAVWESVVPTNLQSVALSGLAGGTTVSGHDQKFRELYWRREGPYGGLTDFQLMRQDNPDTTLTLSGHVLPEDYRAVLSLDRNDIGFIHSGVDQYRKYYNDVGGYDPTVLPAPLSLNDDLYLTIGKAWVDFGLTLPNWPRMVLGYEYDYRRGNEGSTSWGAAGTGNHVNIAPTSENIHEGTHIIKFDLDAEVQGVTIEDRFRGEFYSLNTHYTNQSSFGLESQNVSEGNTYFQGANSIRVEKQFKDWLFGSAGYFYSKLNSQASFTNVARGFSLTLNEVPEITLDRESHVANVNALLGPLDGMTFSTGVQGEWTTQHGFGMGNLSQLPTPFNFTAPATLPFEPTTLLANYDEKSATETIDARYTKIPFTALFVDVRLKQDSIGENENDLQPTGNFVENVAFSSRTEDIRTGFSTSPWRSVSFTADYHQYENDSHYPTNTPTQPSGGYPGYFRSRELLTEEAELKLVLRPCNWFKTTLSYQYLTTDFRDDANPAVFPGFGVVAPGGNTLTGHYVSQNFTINAILTPHPRVYIDASFSYQPTKTQSANSTNLALSVYEGDTYSADVSGTYVLSQTTDLTITGIFSDADYGQNHASATPPVDMEYQQYGIQAGLNRRFSKNLSGGLQYGFNYYHEPSSGNANDFRAHTVFVTMNYRLP